MVSFQIESPQERVSWMHASLSQLWNWIWLISLFGFKPHHRRPRSNRKRLSQQKRPHTECLRCLYGKGISLSGHRGAIAWHCRERHKIQRHHTNLFDYWSHWLLWALWLGIFMHGSRWPWPHNDQNVRTQINYYVQFFKQSDSINWQKRASIFAVI